MMVTCHPFASTVLHHLEDLIKASEVALVELNTKTVTSQSNIYNPYEESERKAVSLAIDAETSKLEQLRIHRSMLLDCKTGTVEVIFDVDYE